MGDCHAIRPRVLCFPVLLLIAEGKVRGAAIVEYTFADGNATTATNTGTLGAAMNGAVSGGSITASPLSADGNGLLLGGANGDGVSLPNGFDFGSQFTISVLARLDGYQNQQSILFDDFGSPGVILSVPTAPQRLRFTVTTADDGDVTLSSPDPFPLGSWQRVEAVYNGSQALLMINGVVDAMSATGAVQNHPLVTPNLGVESDNSAFPWNGAIDDFSSSLVAIPEPTALPLLATGLAAAGLLGGKRVKRAAG